jgi:hypothetical protein
MLLARKLSIDKYAREARAWRNHARFDFEAARILFTHKSSIVLCFPAATLGHHALEMYLKTALICEGFTIFDPKKIRLLDPSIKLTADDCAWGHDLIALGKLLAGKRPDFDLSEQLAVNYWYHKLPKNVERGLEMVESRIRDQFSRHAGRLGVQFGAHLLCRARNAMKPTDPLDSNRHLWQSVLLITNATLLGLVLIWLPSFRPVLIVVAFTIFFGKFLFGVAVAYCVYRVLQQCRFPRWANLTAAVVLCIGVCGFVQGLSESHNLVRIINSIPAKE